MLRTSILRVPKPSFTWSGIDIKSLIPTSNRSLPTTKKGPFVKYAGRTKAVVNGDLSGSFKALNTTLRVNNVAREYRAQKFYEKPSDKRGRLSRERHRRRFLLGVKRLVSLVKATRTRFN